MTIAQPRQALIVTDLGYGDSGKGTMVDYLVREHNAHTVIRHNGGAQAAHNVITPDGRHHTFAQFGAGMFWPGVQTYLSRFMLVEPYALFNEEAHLRQLGVQGAFARMMIDRRALVTTLYHQAANRLRERARGDARHGSCGIGIGETVADHLQHGDDVLFVGDLPDVDTVRRKLRFLRDAKYAELEPLLPELCNMDGARDDLAVFDDDELIDIAADNYLYLTEQVTLTDEADWLALRNQPGAIVFEGAQGVLLDEWYGFAPYTTWSTTTSANALTLLDGYAGEVTRLGVLRSYFTRHGAGPFVTEVTLEQDAALVQHLPEYHNGHSDWQQGFRVGYFDQVAARYALAVNGGLDALAITHMDRVARLDKVCVAYAIDGVDDFSELDPYFEHADGRITGIRVRRPVDLDHQHKLTAYLQRCRPVYEMVREADYLAMVGDALRVPITLTSHGPTADDKQAVKFIPVGGQ